MDETFRQFLDRLRDEGELADIRQAVDIGHIATLVDQSDKALFFHDVLGYDVPVVSGLLRSQKRAALSMGCRKFSEIEGKLRKGLDNPISPRYIESTPLKEVTRVGELFTYFGGIG